MVKIPKYIISELEKVSQYANKMERSMKKFEQWVYDNIDDEFDMSLLRAMGSVPPTEQTEALADIEHGCLVDVDDIERVINLYIIRKQSDT